MTSEGTIDENNPLACTFLKFYLDYRTEYSDIDEYNNLIDR
jgi:hypothetical protein